MVKEKNSEENAGISKDLGKENSFLDSGAFKRKKRLEELANSLEGFEILESLTSKGAFKGCFRAKWDYHTGSDVALLIYMHSDEIDATTARQSVIDRAEGAGANTEENLEIGTKGYFDDESKALFSLGEEEKNRKNPNILQLLHHYPGPGTKYIVLAYAEGPSLEELIIKDKIKPKKKIDHLYEILNLLFHYI